MGDYTQKWAYNKLNSKQQQIYARLFDCAKTVGESIDVSDLGYTANEHDLGELDTAFWAFDYDNPQFLELGSGYSYSYSKSSSGQTLMKTVKISYARPSSQIRQSEFDNTAQKVLANANAQSSDYEKLKYVHDWIVNNTVYTNNDADYIREADGPIVYGKAVCEGYSKAFMYFAQSMGFECVCVAGKGYSSGKGEDHMWNLVKLGGQWYNVDVTWDDPVMSNGSQTLRYNYFLISDSAIGKDHTVGNPFAVPSAPNSYAQ